MEPQCYGGMKVCSNDLGHMTKVDTMPIFDKNPSEIFSKTSRPMTFELRIQHQWLGPWKVCSNDDHHGNISVRKWPHHSCTYRRLSLSQSPGDQTKYFELSVVWDSQFVTSFTLYMFMDCLDNRDYNWHVHVFGNDILEFKYPLSCSFVTLILRRLRQKLKNVDEYLHQRTPLKSVQSLKLQRRRYVHFGYNQCTWLRDCWLLE